MAGSWSNYSVGKGEIAGHPFKKISAEFECDATDGSLPNWTVTSTDASLNGVLLGSRVVFDGDDTPAEIDMQIADDDGIDLLGGAAAGDNKFTDSGKVSLSPAEPFNDSLTVAIATAAANANAGAKGKVILNVLL